MPKSYNPFANSKFMLATANLCMLGGTLAWNMAMSFQVFIYVLNNVDDAACFYNVLTRCLRWLSLILNLLGNLLAFCIMAN